MTAHTIGRLRRTKVLLMGCSAGGFKVIFEMLKALPKDLPIAVLVVIHRNPNYETNIEASMMARSQVIIKVAEDKEPIRAGTVYFSPAGYHLLVEPDLSLSLDISDPVNFSRPSIDVTMQSAADVFGSATTAILLSGANHDGAKGMLVIHRKGGFCIVQHPDQAEIRTMPDAAIALDATDLILTNDELIAFCRELNHILTSDHPWIN